MSDETSVVRTIGRYHAVGELGRGGMGVVYRGFDPVIGRTVALKTIAFTADGLEGQQLRERLYREAAAAGTLTHPNIVTVYDVIEDGGTTAVAMEFVEGSTLGDLITEKGPLPLDRALDLFEQICSALDYAGSKGLVHRDVKPANILLTTDGKAKITDFGIARIAVSGVTQTGTIMGSPSYMSPEQVRGQALDPRSDLFSAAVVLYEMLTGSRPFGGDDVATTMYRIVNEAPQALDKLNPTVSPVVSAILERALAKNPADRFQTGAELVAELKRAIASPGLTSPSLSLPPLPLPAPAPARSRMVYVIGALAVVLVAVIAFGLLGGGSGQPPAQSSAGPAAEPTAAPVNEGAGVDVTSQVGTPAQPPVTPQYAPPTPASNMGPVSTMPPLNNTPTRLPEPASSGGRAPGAGTAGAGGRTTAPGGIAPADRTAPRTQAPPASREESSRFGVAVPQPGREAPPAAPAVNPTPPAPAAPPPPTAAAPGGTAIRVEFDGPPYPVTLFADDAQVGRVETGGGTVPVEPGTIRLRAVNESIFLNAEIAALTVRAGERKAISLPGTASAVVGVRGDDYTGVRVFINDRPVPGPYPAQVARIAAGTHRVTYRWMSGARAGTEISDAVKLTSGGHYIVRAVPDNAQIQVQQVR